MTIVRYTIKAWEVLVYSNIWVSLSATLFCFYSSSVLGYKTQTLTLAIVFISTFCVYNFQRIYKNKLRIEDPHSSVRKEWLEKYHKPIFILTSVLFLALCILAFFIPIKAFVISALVCIIPIWYVVKPSKLVSSLREYPLLKLFSVGFTWAFALTIFPTLVQEINLVDEDWLYVLSTILFIVSLTIPFDIRDAQIDVSIKTLPQKIGNKKSILLALVLLFTSFILEYSFATNKLSFLLYGVICSASILLADKFRKADLYYSGWIDGLIGLKIILLWI